MAQFWAENACFLRAVWDHAERASRFGYDVLGKVVDRHENPDLAGALDAAKRAAELEVLNRGEPVFYGPVVDYLESMISR